MSKDITIEEGGVARSFGAVKKLKTALQGGSSCLWVPEDEVKLTTKNITENGTYKAEDDDVYGWDTINVNVASDPSAPGSTVVGTDPIDGEEYMIEVGEDGELEKTRLPVSITVTRPPNKTEYEDGETINPTGIIVHAYYADGTDYGTVLNSELSYFPTTAEAEGGSGDVYITPDGIVAAAYTKQAITYENKKDPKGQFTDYVCPTDMGGWYLGGTSIKGEDSRELDTVYITSYNGHVYAVRDRESSYGHLYKWKAKKTFDPDYPAPYELVASTGAGGGYPKFRDIGSDLWGKTDFPVSSVDPTGQTMDGAYSQSQSITVQWPRIGDRKVLTASFDITVTG